jgi:hypothetical protein
MDRRQDREDEGGAPPGSSRRSSSRARCDLAMARPAARELVRRRRLRRSSAPALGRPLGRRTIRRAAVGALVSGLRGGGLRRACLSSRIAAIVASDSPARLGLLLSELGLRTLRASRGPGFSRESAPREGFAQRAVLVARCSAGDSSRRSAFASRRSAWRSARRGAGQRSRRIAGAHARRPGVRTGVPPRRPMQCSSSATHDRDR